MVMECPSLEDVRKTTGIDQYKQFQLLVHRSMGLNKILSLYLGGDGAEIGVLWRRADSLRLMEEEIFKK